MATTAKRLGKRVIGYPEHVVPTISSRDWVNGLKRDPIRFVGSYSIPWIIYGSLLYRL